MLKNRLGRQRLAQKASQTFFGSTSVQQNIVKSISNSFLDLQWLAKTTHFSILFIGPSLSEPHTSGSLVWSSCIQTTTKKFRLFPYLVGLLVYVTKGNEHSLLTIPFFLCKVLRVVNNKMWTLLGFHIWLYSCSCRGE